LSTVKTRIEIKEDNNGTSNNITAKVGNFGEIKSQQLRNQAGGVMTVQGAGFASVFQFENDTLTLAPSASQWSESDMPHAQVTTRSGAVGNLVDVRTSIQELSAAPKVKEWNTTLLERE
jgi:hypothetical protein